MRSKIKLILGLAIMLCLGLNFQCATGPQPKGESLPGQQPEESPQTCIAKHTVAGCATGAIIGAVSGIVKGGKGVGRKVAIGAGAGAAVGFAYAWGKCFDKFSRVNSERIRDYDETVRTVNYRKEEGTKVKITNYSLNPTIVRPGETVIFNAQYYALDPIKERDLQVTEMRILKVYDEQKKEFVEVGRVPNDITVAPGLRKADGTFSIPDQTPEGKYLIGFEVTCAGKIDKAEMPLTVKKA